ncbi:MAG TPA: YetF domain-containing protein [Opitutaceae bacterium]|nr:YetF domain-containing protein [Opitutaceae bacterium]
MDPVVRAIAVYVFLLLVFRAFGKRSLAQITTFDFVLLLIIAETTQQALLGEDFSITNAFILIATLFLMDGAFSFVKEHSAWFDRVTEGLPLIVLKDGKVLAERVRMSRINEADILAAARELQGLERLDQIKYAVLEKNGSITIIPKEGAA